MYATSYKKYHCFSNNHIYIDVKYEEQFPVWTTYTHHSFSTAWPVDHQHQKQSKAVLDESKPN